MGCVCKREVLCFYRGVVAGLFLAGRSNFLERVVFTLWFLYGSNKRDITCLSVSFRGAGRQILFPLDRARLAFSPFPLLAAC